MNYRLLITALIATPALTACVLNQTQPVPPIPAPVPPVVKHVDTKVPVKVVTIDCPPAKTASESTTTTASPPTLTVLGAVEEVQVFPAKIILRARIDSGATTTSISAVDIQEFERDGDQWVQFNVPTADGNIAFKRPLVGHVKVKRHGEDPLKRPVVNLQIKIGSIEQRLEVSLADRRNYEYPVLIGRNFLKDIAIVDVSRQYTQTIVK